MAKCEIKEIKGKVLESVTFFDGQDGVCDLDIRFQDKTGLHLRLRPLIALEAAELRDWKEGEGELVKKFV